MIREIEMWIASVPWRPTLLLLFVAGTGCFLWGLAFGLGSSIYYAYRRRDADEG